MKRKLLCLTLALPVMLLQTARAQVPSRLIGHAHWTNNGISFMPSDSTNYIYSGTRGGALNLDPTKTTDQLDLELIGQPLQYDNAAYWLFSGDSAYLSTSYFQTFDANNNVATTVTALASGTPYSKTIYTYNAANQPIQIVSQLWNGTAWGSIAQDLYSYNANGKLYSDQAQVYNTVTASYTTSSEKTYYYDSALNLTSEVEQVSGPGGLQYHNEWERTYSPTGQLLTTSFNVWNGTAFAPESRYSHDYDSTGKPVSLVEQDYNTTTMEWDNNSLALYSNFTSGNLPQTVTVKSWDTAGSGSWVNSMQFTYTYNAFNQVTSSMGISWNVSDSGYEYANGNPADNYYYEGITTGVRSLANNSVANVYPVPAQNMLHVDLNWATAQSATIIITDMAGNAVRTLNIPSGNRFNGAISVNDLASGMYIISINGEKEQIVKQIVVAH